MKNLEEISEEGLIEFLKDYGISYKKSLQFNAKEFIENFNDTLDLNSLEILKNKILDISEKYNIDKDKIFYELDTSDYSYNFSLETKQIIQLNKEELVYQVRKKLSNLKNQKAEYQRLKKFYEQK